MYGGFGMGFFQFITSSRGRLIALVICMSLGLVNCRNVETPGAESQGSLSAADYIIWRDHWYKTKKIYESLSNAVCRLPLANSYAKEVDRYRLDQKRKEVQEV